MSDLNAQEPSKNGGADDDAHSGNWKQRYDALRRFRDEEHQRTLEELNRLRTSAAASDNQSGTASSKPFLSEDELADLGETEQRAFGQMNERLSRQEAELQRERERANQRFYDGLTSKVSDWEITNRDAAFLNWLAQFDPSIGRTRKQLFDAYVDDRDAEGAASFFIDFKKQLGQATSAPSPSEPGKSGADPSHQNMLAVYTHQEVNAHFAELERYVRDRTFRHGHPRYDELMQRDKEISKAVAEGRVE